MEHQKFVTVQRPASSGLSCVGVIIVVIAVFAIVHYSVPIVMKFASDVWAKVSYDIPGVLRH